MKARCAMCDATLYAEQVQGRPTWIVQHGENPEHRREFPDIENIYLDEPNGLAAWLREIHRLVVA